MSHLVNCIDTCAGPFELVTGSKDGSVKVWDPRTNEAVVSLNPSITGIDCWAVCFGDAAADSQKCVVSGYDNGDVKLFDLRKMATRWETNVHNGVCQVSFDRKDIKMNKLSVSCLESQLHVFDMRTFNKELGGYACGTNHIGKSTIWGSNYLPQNREIMAINDGAGNLSLYKYTYPAKRAIKNQETGLDFGVPGTIELLCQPYNFSVQPIVSFDWHNERRGLGVLVSLDQQIKITICTKLETI